MSETEVEAIVKSAIADLMRLSITEVNEDADLFDLGLDSVMIMSLVVLIKRRFGIVLSPHDLFIAPTPRSISIKVRELVNV